MRSPRYAIPICILGFLLLPGVAPAQLPETPGRGPGLQLGPQTGRIIVRVVTGKGMPLSLAQVRLYSDFRTFTKVGNISDNGQAVFDGVPPGEYRVEVRAPGYETSTQTTELFAPETTTYVHVEVRPTSTVPLTTAPSGPPLLTPKARKEMDKALEALRKGRSEAVRKHLENLKELAPGHPDVSYLWGVYLMTVKQLEEARPHLEKALALDPKHSAALLALGGLLMQQRAYPEAIPVLERAAALQQDTWQALWMLAGACFRDGQVEAARTHAEQALIQAKGEAPQIRLLLAEVLDAQGETEPALRQLETLITGHPRSSAADRARQLQAQILERNRPAVEEATARPPENSPAVPAAALEPALPERSWAPPDVDEEVPAVAAGVSCPLDDVLAGAGRRAQELVRNLERFTATERVEHAVLEPDGTIRRVEETSFDYVVFIQEIREGVLAVDESRDGGTSYSSFPTNLVTNGLPALALLFHPYYVEDFEVRCEGLGRWGDQPAWQVYFRQKDDVGSRVRVYRVGGKLASVALKGRAWIASDSHRILRLETDLVSPLKEIKLEREHLAIRYAPVEFPHRKLTLWLPASAELYLHLGGRRYRHRHSFSDHMLFSVDTFHKEEQIPDPDR